MNVTIKTDVNAEDMKKFYLYHILWVQRTYLQSIFFVIFFLFCVASSILYFNWFSAILSVATLVGIFLPWIVGKTTAKNLIKKSKKMQAGFEAVYEMDDTHFREIEKNRENQISIEWANIYMVCENRDYIYVYVNDSQAFPVRKSDIGAEDLTELRRLFKEKLKRYKAYKKKMAGK